MSAQRSIAVCFTAPPAADWALCLANCVPFFLSLFGPRFPFQTSQVIIWARIIPNIIGQSVWRRARALDRRAKLAAVPSLESRRRRRQRPTYSLWLASLCRCVLIEEEQQTATTRHWSVVCFLSFRFHSLADNLVAGAQFGAQFGARFEAHFEAHLQLLPAAKGNHCGDNVSLLLLSLVDVILFKIHPSISFLLLAPHHLCPHIRVYLIDY